ncbi:hypothetical protein R1flu_008322 [Riccia fluitans]|uniref:Myb/SANT-like DNA-binding domain-containing protein n=1 Tax=Riccia fluitans TaxID=41844 RepID=A0ABD1YEX4_9MARC
MVETLLDLKKLEWEEYKSQSGREHMISADMRWQRISEKLTKKGCNADASQCCGKWETIVEGYKKVKDHNNRSGNAPFGSLNKTERKDLKLPLDFLEKWLEILDIFYGQHASINPPCMIESTEVPNAGNVTTDVEDEGAREIPPIDSDRGATLQAKRPQMSHNNYGVQHNIGKQKKNTSMSAIAIVDAMGHFTSSFVAAEER